MALGDVGIAGQAVHTTALTEPAQHQHRLAERAERPAAARSADSPPVHRQQTGQDRYSTAWRGTSSEATRVTEVKPLAVADMILWRDLSYQGLHT